MSIFCILYGDKISDALCESPFHELCTTFENTEISFALHGTE